MGSISAFPITTQKASETSVVTALSNTNHLLLYTTDLKLMTFLQFKTLLAFQASSQNLTTLSAITPGLAGLNILALDAPSGASYFRVSDVGVITYLTPGQLVADLLANGGAVDLTSAQSLTGPKKINGVTLSAASATTPDAAATDIPAPSDTYPLKLIKVGYTGGTINFRFTKSTDVTFPSSGVLATVSGVRPVSDDTKTSATTLILDTADGAQVDVTGTTTITTITLAEDVEKTVRFTGILTLTHGASLVLPGGKNKITAAGDYAVFKGGSGGVVTLIDYHNSVGTALANIDGGIVKNANLRLRVATVATLGAGTQGDTALVTDALTPVHLVIATGGGLEVVPVFHNGTAWIVG